MQRMAVKFEQNVKLSVRKAIHNHNYQGGTGKFIYKALILYNKQFPSNMIVSSLRGTVCCLIFKPCR